LEVFRTADVQAASRAAYWSDVYSRRFAPIAVEPTGRGQFQAELKVGSLGLAEVACVRSRPAAVERKAEPSRERMVGFVILVRGRGRVSHCGVETEVDAGDIVMTDSTEGMRSRFETPVEGITLRVAEAALRSRLPRFEAFRGQRLPGSVGLADTVVAMARTLSVKLDGALPPACATKASGHLLDMLATSYAHAFATAAAETSLTAARRARVSAFIESNLSDPDLSPGSVASSLGISPRYLRKLMAEKGETASSFILRRRLEECARALSSDVRSTRPVTEVAFSWGFNSTAHFARVFKSKYGQSPRSFRLASRLERRSA
jgi:AraC-like DNA-binding protein